MHNAVESTFVKSHEEDDSRMMITVSVAGYSVANKFFRKYYIHKTYSAIIIT